MLHKCSYRPAQCKTVIEQLRIDDFDVKDSLVYMQWICDSHTEMVSMISTVGEFNEKYLPNYRSSNNPTLCSKITSFISEDVEKNILPGTQAVFHLIFLKIINSYVKK
jgi:hypothetical protein